MRNCGLRGGNDYYNHCLGEEINEKDYGGLL